MSVHARSVSARCHPTSGLEELWNFVLDCDWLWLCDSEINEGCQFCEPVWPGGKALGW